MREVATCDRDFFFNNTATTEIYTLSLHDALPISCPDWKSARCARPPGQAPPVPVRHRGPRPASYRTFVRCSSYRGAVVHSESQPDRLGLLGQPQERRRLDDDLIGLDRDDPEVQAFAEHLDRTHRLRPGFTIEGCLSDVSDFAESANR